MDTSQLCNLFRYDDWANRECLDSLVSCSAPPTRALEVMAHLVGAQWLWINRLDVPAASMPVWPDLTLQQCGSELKQIAATWLTFLKDLAPETLSRMVDYTNSKGEPWQSSTHDILLHILIHSGYHRGQIATLLGQQGTTPAYTDYIHCARQNLLKLQR